MVNETLLVDGNYLCHYVFHGIGGLSTVAGNPTSIVYGMLVQIRNLTKKFRTKRFIFCWDSQSSVRKDYCPTYKGNRHKQGYSEEEKITMNAFYQQVGALQDRILPDIGFPCFKKEGFESDDLLAWFAKNIKGKKIIVTADADLWQCLSDNVVVYNPNKKDFMTVERLDLEHGISNPPDWALVKALAGCPSDNVQGIKGVGEKTAVRFLREELEHDSLKYQAITYGMDTMWRNIDLVKLPHPKLEMKKPKIVFKINLEAYKKVATEIESTRLLDADMLFDWHQIASRF